MFNLVYTREYQIKPSFLISKSRSFMVYLLASMDDDQPGNKIIYPVWNKNPQYTEIVWFSHRHMFREEYENTHWRGALPM